MIVRQVPIQDIQSGQEVWDIHNQSWVHVHYSYDNGHEIELDVGVHTISAEFDHLMFRKLSEKEQIELAG